MADATLNAVNSAQYNAIGHVRLNCNITTPDGGIWDTDFVVDPATPPPIDPLGGLQGDVERWVAANTDQILPFSEETPPAHNDPVQENAEPPEPPPGSGTVPAEPESIKPPDPPTVLTEKVEDQTNDAGITEPVTITTEPEAEEPPADGAA